MIEPPTPSDIEHLAVEAGISVAEACRRAKLTPEVFSRWRRGVGNAGIENVRAIIRELNAAKKERADERDAGTGTVAAE